MLRQSIGPERKVFSPKGKNKNTLRKGGHKENDRKNLAITKVLLPNFWEGETSHLNEESIKRRGAKGPGTSMKLVPGFGITKRSPVTIQHNPKSPWVKIPRSLTSW